MAREMSVTRPLHKYFEARSTAKGWRKRRRHLKESSAANSLEYAREPFKIIQEITETSIPQNLTNRIQERLQHSIQKNLRKKAPNIKGARKWFEELPTQ